MPQYVVAQHVSAFLLSDIADAALPPPIVPLAANSSGLRSRRVLGGYGMRVIIFCNLNPALADPPWRACSRSGSTPAPTVRAGRLPWTIGHSLQSCTVPAIGPAN